MQYNARFFVKHAWRIADPGSLIVVMSADIICCMVPFPPQGKLRKAIEMPLPLGRHPGFFRPTKKRKKSSGGWIETQLSFCLTHILCVCFSSSSLLLLYISFPSPSFSPTFSYCLSFLLLLFLHLFVIVSICFDDN